MNDIEFWHSIVEITQIPDMERKNPNDYSWLFDPFGDNRVYGVKFSLEELRFSWEFFMKEEIIEEAMTSGHCLLASLKEQFPGLDGNVDVKPITSLDLKKKTTAFHELVLPDPKFVYKEICLIKKIINLWEIHNARSIEIYILWQKDDSNLEQIKSTNLQTIIEMDDNYKLKIFLKSYPEIKPSQNKKLLQLKGQMLYLASNIKNGNDERAKIKWNAPKDTWRCILNSKPFSKNLFEDPTGRYLDGVDFTEDKKPMFVNREVVDFSTPSNMPIAIARANYKVNFGFSSDMNFDKPMIKIGYYYDKYGVKTNRLAPIYVDDLMYHLFVNGLTGVGKTHFLSYLHETLNEVAPNVGTLVINLEKQNQEYLYNSDIVLKRGDPRFRVPYYIQGNTPMKTPEEVAHYLISSVGLKNVVVTMMYNVIYDQFKKREKLPEELRELFEDLILWLEENKYHEKYQTNIKRAIKNRVIKLLSDPILNNILKLGSLPKWYMAWKQGKNVYIDLSEFNNASQKLLAMAILQMIRTDMSETLENKLRNLIILDEINVISEKPTDKKADDDDYITAHHIAFVLSKALRALRSRGVGVIACDQKANFLFEGIYSLPTIKLIFRTDLESNKHFITNRDEQEMLAQQENRRALLIDGVHGRKFAIHTIDHSLMKEKEKIVPIKRIDKITS